MKNKYDRIKCPNCTMNFGQEAKFLKHLNSEHNIIDYLRLYLEINHNSVHPTCECSERCDIKLPWMGWKKGFTSRFARGHNARLDTVFSDPVVAKELANKRKEGYRSGKYKVWNVGLTKESSEKVANMSEKSSRTLREGYDSGRIVDWRILDPEKAKLVAGKSSVTKKEHYASGQTKSWNEGLTKETNESVASASIKISKRYDLPNAGRSIKLDELKKRIDVFSDRLVLITPIEEYRNVGQILEFRCVSCYKIQRKNLKHLEAAPICFNCHPKESVAQLEIFEFVKSLGFEATCSDRNVIAPKELDVYVPSHKLAIEYNGLYYHNANVLAESYHQDKHELCRKADVRLLSVFSDEWSFKRPIVEDVIRRHLGVFAETFDANKLQIIMLSPDQTREFFITNHIDGYIDPLYAIGLVDKQNRLVAAMSLSPSIREPNDHLEVVQACCVLGANVKDWLDVLTRFALTQAKVGITSSVSPRFNQQRDFEKSSWKLLHVSQELQSWWTDCVHRYSDFDIMTSVCDGESLEQVAQEASLIRVYGCKNLLYKAS